MSEIEANAKTASGHGWQCYIAGIGFPIIYLLTEPYKSNRFIRFHAFQSIAFTVLWVALTFITDFLRPLKRGVSDVLDGLWFLFFAMWIVLMFRAYRGQMFRLPVIGKLAARLAR
jgi:uncharacterized membrane protein